MCMVTQGISHLAHAHTNMHMHTCPQDLADQVREQALTYEARISTLEAQVERQALAATAERSQLAQQVEHHRARCVQVEHAMQSGAASADAHAVELEEQLELWQARAAALEGTSGQRTQAVEELEGQVAHQAAQLRELRRALGLREDEAARCDGLQVRLGWREGDSPC